MTTINLLLQASDEMDKLIQQGTVISIQERNKINELISVLRDQVQDPFLVVRDTNNLHPVFAELFKGFNSNS